jgi:hypothetical protein
MTEKILLSESNTVVLACSVCNRQKVVDMTPYLAQPSTSKLKAKCRCGNSWTLNLEKRRYTRKLTNLPGDYVILHDGKPGDSGHLLVVDISLKGLKLKLNRKKDLKIGDWLEVDFQLDNKPQTYIKRMVQVKSVDFPFVGTAFKTSNRPDPDIGFYFLEKKRGLTSIQRFFPEERPQFNEL